MNKFIIIVTLLSLFQFQACINLPSTILSQILNLDYQDIQTSYSNVQIISDKYAAFKEKVQKNTTISYSKCVDSIKILKCNNVDQWQSVIEELKLEIQNSEEIEIPFLQDAKEKKIEELRFVLWNMQNLDYENAWQFNILNYFGTGVENSTKQIKIMYKVTTQNLPEAKEEQSEFVQKSNEAQEIEPAQESLAKAKEEYDIADISIQAQTTTNVMSDLAYKIPILKQSLNEFFSKQMRSLQEKKERLKEEILHLRALLANERAIQQKNKEKIIEFEAKINSCKGKPTNIEKDCGSIIVRAQKLYTEIDIINARTNILIKELNNLLQQNGQLQTSAQSEEDRKNNLKSQELARDYDFIDQNERESTLDDISASEPKEQQPIHHINQPNIQEETETVQEVDTTQNSTEPEPESADQIAIEENETLTEMNDTDQMVFSYKQNPEYQAMNENNGKVAQQNYDENMFDGEETSLEKILEKEFADEDQSKEENTDTEPDFYSDKFDYND